jgi:phospholipase/carboxylesterase
MKSAAELCHSEAGLIYRLRRGWPRRGLIVMLHGLSGDEDAMWIFDHALPRSATVIAPRALYTSSFGGYSWTRSAVRADRDDPDFREAIKLLSRFMAEMIALYPNDSQQAIVIGFSQGAALSYALSLTHPELLRGVIALAGFLPSPEQVGKHSSTALRSVQSVPAAQSKAAQPRYLILHGTHDEAVPIDRARAARTVFEARGAIVEYHEHRVGHKVSTQGMKEIAQWLERILS